MSEEKKEKEVILDLSKKIKFSKTIYISLGTLLLSSIVLVIQLLWCLWENNWVWVDYAWVLLFNYAYSIRWGKLDKEEEEQEDEDNESDNNE